MLRDYQTRAIDQLYAWFEKHKTGNPCAVMPTGSGKSWVVAALCKDALSNWPETRILMLTHQKELLEQNAEKLRIIWPGAPLGMYSASIGKRQMGEPITFAGIQSVRNKADLLGWQDLVIIDECHLINNNQQGGYRTLLSELMAINPGLRVIGLTATPYRLGQGMLTDGDDALFSDLIEPVSIEELLHKGHLAKLTSKQTTARLDTSGVHKRGGEYIESELARAVDTDLNNQQAAAEIVQRGQNRKSWLIFCTGVDHSYHMRDCLRAHGISCETVTGGTPKAERARILADFKAGRLRCVTNANVLTTGFDAPDTDLVALLRPTLSPVLYVQMAGRGLRPKSHGGDCLVLDFAGCIREHGPITAINPPGKKGKGGGEAPVKACPQCDELVHLSCKECPECGHVFISDEQDKAWRLQNDDIMGQDGIEMAVKLWTWRTHTSRSSGNAMVKVTYYGNLSDLPVTEYLAITNPGYGGHKAMQLLRTIAGQCGADLNEAKDMAELCELLNNHQPPSMIEYMNQGKFHRVLKREWNHEAPDTQATNRLADHA